MPMPRVRTNFDPWVWLAVAATLALAALPTVGRALAPTPGQWIEVCTSDGLRRVALDAPADAAQADPSGDAHAGACPFCAPGLSGWLVATPP